MSETKEDLARSLMEAAGREMKNLKGIAWETAGKSIGDALAAFIARRFPVLSEERVAALVKKSLHVEANGIRITFNDLAEALLTGT